MALTPESQKALMDILKVKQPESIAAPIQPKIGTNPLTEAYYNYIEGDPLAQQVSGGDPLKKLLRFASEFVPGINTELAQRRGDKVGEALSYLDALGAASVPAKAVAKGAEKAADFTKDMMFLHNLREDALKNYANIGGLPSPSIAVMQKETPLDVFGDITLVGKPSSFDPALPNNPVYSADAYTPRMPEVFYKPSKKALNKLIDDYNNLADITGESNKIANLEFDINKSKKRPTKVFEESIVDFFNNSDAAKLKFLVDETGINLKNANKDNINSLFNASNAGMNDYYKWSNKEINKFLNKDQPFFEKVDSYTGNYKTVPATADAIAKNMKADTQRGGESFYANSAFDNPVSNSPGLARALLSKNLESLDDIKANKGLLYAKPNPSTYDLQGRFEDAVYQLDDLYKSKGRDINTEELIDDYFQLYKDFGSHDEVIKKYPEFKIGADALKDLIDEIEFGKRRYFESKPTRVVDFDEFAGAIVNTNVAPSTLDLLKSYGLQIEKYDPFDPMARTQARDKFQNQMFNYVLPAPLLAGAIATQDKE